MSLGFHVANAVLLSPCFARMTGALWRSAMVAALFALHPLHVESVAWIAERKDVLSAFFFMLTLWAYGRYAEVEVRSPNPKSATGSQESGGDTIQLAIPVRRSSLRRVDTPHAMCQDASRFTFHVSPFYLLSLCFFACGLMSKPMVVTLPFVLLLLDYWPLRRFQPAMPS